MAEKLPQQFGNYTLHKLIARGGMAEIYRATMPGIGGFEKTVAIKKILPHLAENEEFITMLKDEANILVSISDSNIAQVYDLGRLGDSYFIAMEYVHGLDLSHVMKGLQKRGMQIPIEHALYIGSCMCAGLHAAHTNTDKQGNPLDIVHRDVSPHNVIISYAGDVKLIDFGVAKAAVKEGHTQMGVIKGKLLYMAPEQAMAKSLDGRADLFAVGLCMYKMLTNELPFSGDNEFQIYNNILSKEIVPPRELNPQVNQEVNQVVMTMLQRDPNKRYQDGYTAKQDLRRALQNLAPGYTASRLGRFIEEHFSEAAMRRQQDLQDASGPSGVAPRTPSANALGTGQLLADADLVEIDPHTQDTTEAERLQVPAALRATPPMPPTGAPAAEPAGSSFRTQKSDLSTGSLAVEQLAGRQAPAPAGAKKPVAVYLVAALAVAAAILLGYAMLTDDKTPPVQPVAEPPAAQAPAPVEAPAAPLSPTVQVLLDSEPSGAQLFRGQDLLGTTPWSLTLRRSEEPLVLTLQMEGYEEKAFELVPDHDIDQVIPMELDEDGPGEIEPQADVEPEPAEMAPAAAQKPAKPAAKKPAPRLNQPKKQPPPAPKPAAPSKAKPEPNVPALDLWADSPDTSTRDKPARKPAPAKKPAKKKQKKKQEKQDEKSKDILNPFG